MEFEALPPIVREGNNDFRSIEAFNGLHRVGKRVVESAVPLSRK